MEGDGNNNKTSNPPSNPPSGGGGRPKRPRSFYEEIGRKGGKALAAQRGSQFYEQIGRKGGARTAARGRRYYEEIGQKGARRVRELMAAGREALNRAHGNSPAPDTPDSRRLTGEEEVKQNRAEDVRDEGDDLK
jgi:general stress protein YciG